MGNELKNKFVYQSVISVTQVLLPLISYPYITRVLGPANLGTINYVDFLSQMFMIFALFGIPFYGVREIARVRYDNQGRSVLLKEMAVLLGLFSISSIALFALVAYFDHVTGSLLYILAAINILFGAFSFDWYIQGMEEFKFSAIRSVFVRLGMLLAFFVFVKKSSDYAIYFGIFSAGVIAISVMNISKILTENSFSGDRVNIKKHIKPLWHFFLTSSAISIYVYFDAILLQHITNNDAAVGQYTLVLKMVKICQVALLSISVVMMPRLSYLAGTKDFSEISRYVGKLFNIIMTVGIPVCTGMLLLAPEIIITIAGEKFLPAVPVLRILAFVPFVIGLSNLFSFQILVPFKQEKKFLIAVLAGCILSVSLNLLLIPFLSEQGAAYANLATEVIITIITGSYAYRIMHYKPEIKVLLQTILSVLLFIPLVFLSRYLFSSPLAVLLFAVIICAVIYYCVQRYFYKNSFIQEVQHYVSNIITSKK